MFQGITVAQINLIVLVNFLARSSKWRECSTFYKFVSYASVHLDQNNAMIFLISYFITFIMIGY